MIQLIGDSIVADALFAVHIINHTDNFCFFRLNTQAVSFHALELIDTVAIRSNRTHELALGSRMISSSDQTGVDAFQFVAAEHEFHIRELFVGIVLQIVGLAGGDNLAVVSLEYLHDVAGFHGGTSGKTFQINAHDTGIKPSAYQFQQPLHFRSGRQRFTGDNLLQHLHHIQLSGLAEIIQYLLVSAESFLHRHFFKIGIHSGFSQIHNVLLQL